MKIIIEDNKIILYLNNSYIKNTNFNEKEFVENYIKQICKNLQSNFDMPFNGYYNIKIFIDNHYGVIINISKEEIEYLDYFHSQVELNTEIIKDKFLYEIQNLDNIPKEKVIIYKNKDKIYFQLKESININNIIEHIKRILYGKESKKILKQAQIVR